MVRKVEARDLDEFARESILLLGGGSAILLQLAHPSVGRGVAEDSDFAARPLDRLRGTVRYIYAVVFGSDAERAEVRRRVGRAHAAVRSSVPTADGPAYSAYDPDLQLWVAATLYATAAQFWPRVFPPLEDAAAERIYRRFSVLATSLQLPQDSWPEDRAAFARYWNEGMSHLRVTPTTRAVAHDLLYPRKPLAIRPVMPLVRLFTIGLLPPELRAPYGLTWSDRDRRRFDRWMRAMHAVVPRLPLRIRTLARDLELFSLRRSLRRTGSVAGSR